ncbi:hypothetical protein ABW19_dt0204920 [Dactylella cylindrospora]|nr:hypothetical protein ABW19_dt0204920 [Dactylella cylindrospora]
MTTLWKGSVALPDGLPQPTLESVELLSSSQGAPQTADSKISTNGQWFSGAELRVQAIVDASKVPLWLSCGPSLDVQTESEVTANVLSNIFLEQSSSILTDDDDPDEESQSIFVEYKPTRKALLIRIHYTEAPEETEKPLITELVLYGTLTVDTPPPEPITTNGDSQRTPSAVPTPPSLSVYALPLSSRLAKEKKLHTSVKQESLDPGKAKFLVPIIGRKRKVDTIFDEYDKKRAYFASLPPGLRRDWHHQRSNSFGSLKDESLDGDSQKSVLSRSIAGGEFDYKRPPNDDSRLRRERSQSILQTRLREAAERPSTSDSLRREPFGKPLRTGSDLSILRRSDSFAGARTRNHTPDIKSEFSQSTSAALTSSTTSKFAERNKMAASKLIMGSMRLYGLQRARPGEVKIESDEEEYKTVYHNTLRSVTFSLRKSWNMEIIGVAKLKETTEYLMKVFVGGSGLPDGGSDKDEEEDNPFKKSRIGLKSNSLFGKSSREDTLVGEDSFLYEDSQQDVSQVILLDD